MSQQKNERLALACADIDTFAEKHGLESKDVLQLIGSVTGRLLGGTSREIEAERTAEGQRLASVSADDGQLYRYHAGMMVRRDVALDAESLPFRHGLLYPSQPSEGTAERLADVVPLFQDPGLKETGSPEQSQTATASL